MEKTPANTYGCSCVGDSAEHSLCSSTTSPCLTNTHRRVFLPAGGYLLWLCGRAASGSRGAEKIAQALDDGSALRCFRKMMEAQGVPPDVAGSLASNSDLGKATHVEELMAQKTGERVCGGHRRRYRTTTRRPQTTTRVIGVPEPPLGVPEPPPGVPEPPPGVPQLPPEGHQ